MIIYHIQRIFNCNFIINSFYGISKNKKGKEVSNYDKYQPWVGEEFSGRIKYELDNGEIYEVFRDFRKKNPKIFNSNMEDISKEFNIDKNKGNEFFYEQTKIDEELFLSTLAINQSEVKLENQAQNMLIQKIANLAQTGDDSTSFKRVIDRINRRQLDEVGTDRTREKPINIVKKRLQELEKEKQDLEQYKNFKYKYEEYSKNNGGVKIDLLKNFRSRSEVLESINLIFNLIMGEEYGGVDYQNNHAMIYGNFAYSKEGLNNNDNNMEIMKYDYQNKEYSNVEIEAFTIFQDIKKKVKSKYQVFDFNLNKNRDVCYNDFCIILDRGTDMPKYKKIFEYAGIPMDVYLDSDLIEANDIKIIRNIIKLILLINSKEYNLEMRYAFVSIARSFIGSLTDAEIFNYINENNFYDSAIYKSCFKLANNIDCKTPSIILREIISEFNFYENLIKVANIDSAIFRINYLIELSTNMESLGFTIKDFLEYLDSMIDNGGNIRYKEARGMGNCVKIMNIHKSKGLEFPICYFAGFKKNFNFRDLNERFIVDNFYGIITPFFKEGIGSTLIKTLVTNRYYKEEISEKIRLFYVALTRVKEKIIIVLPSFKNEMKARNRVLDITKSEYRSFYDFMNSISLNLSNYIKNIDINQLEITKDYEILNIKKNKKINSQDKIDFRTIKLEKNLINNLHASKIIKEVITENEQKTLDFGTKMHEMLEMTDFNDLTVSNKYVNNLRDTFDFKNAIIYKELEFIFTKDNKEYHGIIDLMLEYDNEIKIIDYKLKNIDDENYIKQLSVYYDYIKSISDKKIKLYLYSLMDNKIKEITKVLI